jgi:hypothetical protein
MFVKKKTIFLENFCPRPVARSVEERCKRFLNSPVALGSYSGSTGGKEPFLRVVGSFFGTITGNGNSSVPM